MARGRGRSGSIPNEEIPNREHSIQEVMIEDLQRQVAELTRCLAMQNLDDHDLDDRNSESSFENPYRNTILGREQSGRGKRYGDFNFRVELPDFSGTLQAKGFIDWLHEVERIFDYKEVPDRLKVKLVAIRLKE